MHLLRLSCLLLGAWLAGSMFMAMVIVQNARSADQLVARPAALSEENIEKLGQTLSRDVLRYHSSELNRWYIQAWESIQLGLACLLILVLWRAAPRKISLLATAFLMLAAVVSARWFLTPEIVRLGRLIDFVPPDQPSPERSRFWNLQAAYVIIEAIKLSLGAMIAVRLLIHGGRHRSTSRPAAATSDAVLTASDTPRSRD